MRRALLLGLVVPLLAACGPDRHGYCDAVEEHQEELGELIGSAEPDALLQALDIFRELEEQAPDDIVDEWTTLTDSISGLGDAIRAAGADPETYDPADPSVSPEDRKKIEAAADRLTSQETRDALLAVDQQARDVCHTPLSL